MLSKEQYAKIMFGAFIYGLLLLLGGIGYIAIILYLCATG